MADTHAWPQSPWARRLIALGLFFLLWILMVATLGHPGMAWDEGFTVQRAERVHAWLARFAAGREPWFELLDPAVLDRFWPFAREEPDGHPPAYALLALAGHVAPRGLLGPLEAYRLGAATLFCATAAAFFLFLAQRAPLWVALTAVWLWALSPQVFGHAHFALYDVPLSCFWLLAALSAWRSLETGATSWLKGLSWAVGASLSLALAAATKFTAFLIPLALLLWTGWVGCRHGRWPRWCPSRAGGPVWGWAFLAVSLPLILAAPEIYRIIGRLEEVDREVRARMVDASGAELRLVPRRVAEQVRQEVPSRLPGWALFGAGPILGAVFLYRLRLVEAPTPQRAFHLGHLWLTLLGVTPMSTLLLVPSWWPDPVQRIAIFLWSNLTRERTTWIPTYFLGTTYEFSLPWYNTLVWIMVATPPLTLLLVGIGLAGLVVRQSDRWQWPPGKGSAGWLGTYFLCHAATLLVVRALPGAPGHDGVRQLLPVFAFLIGLVVTAPWKNHRKERSLQGLALVAALWTSVVTALYHPVQLSYYSEFIGGLPGASQLGFEPTYYWDALTKDVLEWLNQNTGRGEKVLFSSLPLSFDSLRRWGRLQVNFLPSEPGRWKWYVLQNRPGLFAGRPQDRWLAQHGQAAYVRRCLGVPLIWVFSFQEYERALRATADGNSDAAQ
jgi:hypothetical protein